jgi:hypothetical protein
LPPGALPSGSGKKNLHQKIKIKIKKIIKKDSVLNHLWPTEFGKDPFSVVVRYNSQGSRAIVVDILSLPNYAFFGKGFVYVGSGTKDAVVTVTPQGDLNPSTSYVLKAWIVDRATYDKDPSIA